MLNLCDGELSNPSPSVAALIHSRAAIRERERHAGSQYCKTPVDNTRSDIDRSSSGTYRNDCSAAGGIKISEADAHTVTDQGREKKEEANRLTNVCTRVPIIFARTDRKGVGKYKRNERDGKQA